MEKNGERLCFGQIWCECSVDNMKFRLGKKNIGLEKVEWELIVFSESIEMKQSLAQMNDSLILRSATNNYFGSWLIHQLFKQLID